MAVAAVILDQLRQLAVETLDLAASPVTLIDEPRATIFSLGNLPPMRSMFDPATPYSSAGSIPSMRITFSVMRSIDR